MLRMNQKPDDNSDQLRTSEVTVWQWPLAQSGWKGYVFVAFLTSMFIAVQVRTGQFSMACMSVLSVLFVTFWYWLPVRYVFRDNVIERNLMGFRQIILGVPFVAAGRCLMAFGLSLLRNRIQRTDSLSRGTGSATRSKKTFA